MNKVSTSKTLRNSIEADVDSNNKKQATNPRRRFMLQSSALALGTLANISPAMSENDLIRVKAFPGAQNLPMWVGLEKGNFSARGLNIELAFTINSDELRADIAEGRFDLAHAAADNSVAIREMTGKDSVILMGGDSSMNELVVQPDIKTMQDLRGKSLIVDAPNTAYALQAKKALSLAGVSESQYQVIVVGGTGLRYQGMLKNPNYSASTLNPPFSIQAKQAGFRSLGRMVDLVGPYQASSMFSMRKWVDKNSDKVERYIAAWITSLRWATDPKNKTEVVEILTRQLKLEPSIINETYKYLLEPGFGLEKDAKFSEVGFKNLLNIREEIEKSKPLNPIDFVDLSYYNRALKLIN